MENDETLASGDPPAPPADKPGSRIGKYQLLRPLGAGGMGVVWAAQDPDLDREVAIKLLRGASAGPEQRTRLLREARAMARLKHPNVLTVYEVDTDGARDFIAMELVDGGNLDTWLHTKPPAREVWDALLAAGRGLAAAHDAGLVHRDFKPHNVLRSRDGRILVTDFGLARGQAEEPGLATTLDPGASAGDSILDVKLTTTGQLLGTPAYMATEQFAGETPDPRTDQFAFCVTAWEALTGGERPYAGTTIEELRTATAAGRVVEGSLPAGVRRVLVRGLAVKREARWPDMRALLGALERARHTWRRRAMIAVPVLVLGTMAAAFALRAPSSAPARARDICEPPEQAFATTWSPTIRQDLLHAQPTATRLAARLDDYRGRWLAGYAKACTRAPAQRTAAVNCYYSKRDDIAVLVELLQQALPESVPDIDAWAAMSSSDPCGGDDPIASPRLPDDERRPKVIAFLAKLYANMLMAPSSLVQEAARVRDQAKEVGWEPLEPRLEEAIGIAAQESGKREIASRAYRKAADLARSDRDFPTEARARLGVLEVGMDEIVDDIPRTAFEQELRDATLAIKDAGNDPALLAALDVNRGIRAAYVAEELPRAIELLEGAYATFMKLRDTRRAQHAAVVLAELRAVRGAAGDLDRAAAVMAEAQALGTPPPGRVPRDFRNATYWIAWLRGDLAAAHAALDTMGGIEKTGKRITGRVVNDAGVPVPGAHVIEWTGELFGDASRAFTDRTYAPLHDAVTDGSGAFEIEASDGDAIIAELDDRRSQPVPARDRLVLALRPTHALTGTVDVGGDPAAGVEPFVRFAVTPTSSWAVSTAPLPDGHFTIAGLPDAPGPRLGAIGTHWPRQTGRRIDVGPAVDHAVVHWPVGVTADIEAQAKSGTVWELGADVHPKTRAEVEHLAATATDVATVRLAPIGWANTTAAGISNYGAGNTHAVIRDIGPGPQTVCVALETSPNVECRRYKDLGVPATVRDGRHWFSSSISLYRPPESGSQQHPLGAVLRSDP